MHTASLIAATVGGLVPTTVVWLVSRFFTARSLMPTHSVIVSAVFTWAIAGGVSSWILARAAVVQTLRRDRRRSGSPTSSTASSW